MMQEQAGRTASVTGGGNVVIGDLDDDRGSEVVERLGARASFVHLDVTSEDQVWAAFAATVERHGVVDCFFNNAGAVGTTGVIQETRLNDWNATIGLLLTSMFLGVKHAVRTMRPRGGLGPHAYTAAKHGLLGLVQSVAVEISAYGLRINCVAPGGTASSLSAGLLSGDPDDLTTAYRRLAAASSSGVPTTSDDVATAAVFLASRGAARINGACLVVDGGDDVLSDKGRSYYG